MATTLKSLIMSFTKSVDLYNYLLKNHHRRTAITSYHIGKAYGLNEEKLSDLVIAAALHDIGALTVSERDELVKMDVDNPQPHARLGSYMLDSFEPFHKISKILFYHHWRYDQDALFIEEKGEVPIESYILHVADRIDILTNPAIPALFQKNTIIEKIKLYSGTLFHPDVIKNFEKVAQRDVFWLDMDNLSMETLLGEAISDSLKIEMNMDLLEQFAYTISKIIDCRSKFTISHSFGVSAVAYEIAELMECSEEKTREIRVAGLFHDIGKIAISNELIEKNGKLSADERTNVQTHAYFTDLILKDIEGINEIAVWASHHHENHDGSGYPENLTEKNISEEIDILSYADIYTALSEDRPYRRYNKKKHMIFRNGNSHVLFLYKLVISNKKIKAIGKIFVLLGVRIVIITVVVKEYFHTNLIVFCDNGSIL